MPNIEFTVLCDKLAKSVPQVVDKAIEDIATDLFEKSQAIVPFDTGALSRSGRIEKKGLAERDVIYGGNSKEGEIPYAHRLHEHPEYNFQNGRQGKYLENPLRQNTSKYNKHVQNKVRQAL